MGVKTKITLKELNQIFIGYNFTVIEPTSDGVIDTTYILSTKDEEYILKKYERALAPKIEFDNELLKHLKSSSLNVPRCIDENDGWYIYEKLQGITPKNITTKHIQALGRFLAKMHKVTYKKVAQNIFYNDYEIPKLLRYAKNNHYYYYKKLSSLKNYKPINDGIIHGDLFKDNSVFEKEKIGVFDFVDSGGGSFVFDAAVSLMGFGVKKENHYFINLFLNTYNQRAPKKLLMHELKENISVASKFYALLRIEHHNSTKLAKELL